MPLIKAGSLLLSVKPFVYVANLKGNFKLCDTCLKLQSDVCKLQRCARCLVVSYCDKQCQKRGWKSHKYECDGMKAEETIPENLERLFSRALVKLQDGVDHFDEVVTENGKVQRRFEDLPSHSAEIRNDKERFSAVQSAIMKLLIWDVQPGDLNLMETCCRIEYNSIAIRNEGNFKLGEAVYLAGSMLNHSCVQNAAVSFENTTLMVRNIKDLEGGLPFPIEQITVCKLRLNKLQPTPERKKTLQKLLYFDCQCEWCQTGKFDKEMRGIDCFKKRCEGKFDSADLSSPCTECGLKLKEDTIKEILKAEKLATDGMNAIKKQKEEPRELQKGSSPSGSVAAGAGDMKTPEMLLEVLKKTKFSEGHWLMMSLHFEVFDSFYRKKNWKKAYEYLMKWTAGLILYLHPHDPILGWCYDRNVQLGIMLRHNLKDMKIIMNAANVVARIIYGKD